jgi:non-ribosomal peptide synthetase component F
MEAEILDQVSRELKLSRAEINRSLSFTNLGGHSLTAIKLMDACKRKGIGLSVGDILKSSSIADLVCRAKPMVVEITESNDEEEKDSVLQETKGSNGDIDIIPLKLAVSDVSYAMESSSPSSASDGMDLSPSPERIPMSEMQLSLIRGSYAHPGHNIVAYHQTCYRRELPLLKNAWQQVIESESIFDTEFVFHDDGGGYLVDTGCVVFPWTETTVMDQDALHAELLQPPAFSEVGYAFRAISMSPAANDSTAVIVWHVHHALVDGFSIRLLLRKVARTMSGLPVVPGPSFAHLAWEREKLIRQRHLEAVAYWDSQKDNLAAASSQIRLPSGNDDDGSQKLGFWNDLATFPVDVSAQELIDHAQRHGITVAAIYYAAWGLVLSVFCDSSSVLFGAVMSGRILPIPGILEVVGNLVNTLPIAITIDERVDTVTFLRQVFSQLVDLSPYDWSVPEHGYDRQFSSVLAMQFDTANLVETTATSHSRSTARMNSEFPLSLTVEADGTIQIQFSRQKYRPQDVEYMGSCFARTLRRLIKPHDTIGMCLRDMLSLKTSQKLFLFGNCFSGMTTETSAHEDLVTLLTRAASQYPDAVAVKQAEQAMSYHQLDLWSDQVAKHLEVFVKRGDIVCVHADPSIYWIVAIYGILKAGAVYCPLNASFTCDVRKTMFELSGAAIYLTPSVSDKRWQPQKCRHCWAVEELLKAREQAVISTDNDDYSPNPSANAYLCFTSGSTGTPKGVLCTHRGLVAFQRDLEVRLFAQPGQSIAQIMSVSFDGSIHEIFSALSYGATLVLPNSGVPFAHLQTVDTCILTPSLAKILDPDDFSNLINVSTENPR